MTTNHETAPGAQPRAACTTDADGRLTIRLQAPAGTGARLLLRLRPKKGDPAEILHSLDLRPADDGNLRAVLETLPVLDEGRWDLYLLPAPGAERLRLRPGLRDLRALVDGHLRDWPSPVAVRVPYVTKDGYLALRTWLRAAHAEVGTVDVTDRSLTVHARLHGATLAGETVMRLLPRGGRGAARTVAVRGDHDGRCFSFTVDLTELAADGGDANRVWDVFLVEARAGTGGAAAPIRLGRLLDDIAHRKEIFVLPATAVGGRIVRPCYTVDNDLSIEVGTGR
ncbi:transferase [Streptomyces sp. NPDC086077]|uniref:transferase n=1 Tax=Streptomyces sp. NPDC086077 TaxID=3154862 RepID=UPI00344737EC